jgi:TonB family protein
VLLSATREGIILVVHNSKAEMREQTQKREAGTSWVGAAYQSERSRMFFALILLLVALGAVVANNRELWVSDGDASVAEETTPEWIPGSVKQTQATPVIPAPKPTKHVATAKIPAQPAASESSVAVTRNAIPPLEVEVVAGNSTSTTHLSNPEKVEMPSGSVDSKTARRAPATLASQRVTLQKTSAPQPKEPAYPLLGRQMKVQGSVLLQAFIAADGTIRDLRVLSGPAILASAAREAAQGWQFKPYLQNGRPVETEAKITVNFTIKVLENGLRDQNETVVALSSRGE